MLIRFTVANFRSIREPLELDMVPSGLLRGHTENIADTPGKYCLLKSAAVYGPNASGKSNLLRAIKALHYLVSKSANFQPNQNLDPYEPHVLEKSYASAPVLLEIAFWAGGLLYEYTVSFTQSQIEREELSFYPKRNKALLFARAAGMPIRFGEYFKGAKKNLVSQTLDNQLFLSKAAQNNAESALIPFFFLADEVKVFPFLNTYRESKLSQLYAKKLATDPAFEKKFNKLIQSLDTGIDSVKAERIDWDHSTLPKGVTESVKQEMREKFEYEVKTYHKVFDKRRPDGGFELSGFNVMDESTGTQSLFVMAGIILDALASGSVLVVDEFEKNLHPNLSEYLIRLFHNPVTNPHNAQLIFATHDITQLSLLTFRRDQIWFVEKDEWGASRLRRCSDWKGLTADTPIDKWYASGRFGGTPIINDVEFMIEMHQEDDEDASE